MPWQHCCFLRAQRRCFSPQDRACQSTLLWIVRTASVLKAVFALAVNHSISVGRHRLITLRSHLHAQHWNAGRRPGFYKVPLPASLLSLCIHQRVCGSPIPAPGPFWEPASTQAVCRGLVGASPCWAWLWECLHPGMLQELAVPQASTIWALPYFSRSHLQAIPHETHTPIHLSKSHGRKHTSKHG